MSTHDLQARAVYQHRRDWIQARLTIVFAAVAAASGSKTRWPGRQEGRPDRPPQDHPDPSRVHTITRRRPLPCDLRGALSRIQLTSTQQLSQLGDNR